MATIITTVKAIDAASGVFAKIAASADGLDKQLKDLGDRVAHPEVDLKDAKFQVGIINAAKRLDKLNAQVADPKVEIDATKFQTEILRINAQLDRLGKKRTTVTVDVKTDRSILGGLGAGFGGGVKGIASLIPNVAGAGVGSALGGLGGLIGGGGAGGITAIVTSVGALAGAITSVAVAASAAAAVAAAAFAAISLAAQAAAGAVTFGLGGAFTGIAVLGAMKFKSVKDSFADLAHQANTHLKTIGAPFIPVMNGIAKAVMNTMDVLTPVFTQFSKIVGPPFEQFAKTLVNSFGQPAVKQSIIAIGKAFGDLLKSLTPMIPGMIKSIADGFIAIAGAVAKNPKAFADFVKFLADVAAFSLQAIAWLTKVAAYIETHFLPAMHDIANIFDGVRHDIAHVWDQIFENSVGMVIRLTHNVETQFDSWRHGIAHTFDSIRNGIANTFDGIRHDISNAFHFIATVFDQFRRFQGQTGAFEKDIAFIWDHIHQNTVMVWDTIRHYLAGVLDIMRNTFATDFDAMRHGIAVVFDGTRHDIAVAWDAIWKTSQAQTKQGADNVVKFFLQMPGRILRALAGLGTDLYNFGRMIWDKFWHGMESIVPNILNWIGHFVASVWDKVKKFFGLGSPSKLFYEAGANLMIGLEKGIKDHAHRAANAATAATRGASGALPGGGAPAANAALARKMMPAWATGQEWNAWNAVAMAESGWNQFARNPSSGAYGIPQALPPSKMGAAANPPQSNPGAQIAWMISYIKSVYGDPIGAAAHENAFHWYGAGLRNGLFTRPTIIGVGERGPERVNIAPAGQGDGVTSAGHAQRIVLELRASRGDQYGHFLLNEIQKLVRVNGGGDVQVALGG
jgi:hypothetical protein